jgi:RHS repeat-associated protein
VTYLYDAWGNLIERDWYQNEVQNQSPIGGGLGPDTATAGLTITRYAQDGWKVSQDFWGNRQQPTGLANFDVWADFDASSGSNTLTVRRFYNDGVDTPTARINYVGSTGSVAWYYTDVRDSVTAVANSSGTVKATISYSAYGSATVAGADPSYADAYRYTGRTWDSATWFYDDRGRWYNPNTGNLETQDPTGFTAGDYNLTRYVDNGPTNASDPSGLRIDAPTTFWKDITPIPNHHDENGFLILEPPPGFNAHTCTGGYGAGGGVILKNSRNAIPFEIWSKNGLDAYRRSSPPSELGAYLKGLFGILAGIPSAVKDTPMAAYDYLALTYYRYMGNPFRSLFGYGPYTVRLGSEAFRQFRAEFDRIQQSEGNDAAQRYAHRFYLGLSTLGISTVLLDLDDAHIHYKNTGDAAPLWEALGRATGFLSTLLLGKKLNDSTCNKTLTIRERLGVYYGRLRAQRLAATADEALARIIKTLVEVEDDYSGIEEKTPPPPRNMPDGRMYPPLPDNIARSPNGSISIRTAGHRIEIGANGSITIRNIRTGEIEFYQPGARGG